MTEITQADRDAAARSFASDHDVPMDCAVCKAILSGEEDDQEIVTRFARHRMEERAAIVAYARGHGGNAWSRDVLYFAEKIEAGEHLK